VGDTLGLEADHRQHAVVEDPIRELEYGAGLDHVPQRKFGANTAWLVLNIIAYDLSRWVSRLGGLVALCLKGAPTSVPLRAGTAAEVGAALPPALPERLGMAAGVRGRDGPAAGGQGSHPGLSPLLGPSMNVPLAALAHLCLPGFLPRFSSAPYCPIGPGQDNDPWADGPF
jgi:hypothetical protein